MSRAFPHSLTLRPGAQFPTKWASTNSVHYVACPRCGAEPEFLCVTPSGRRGRGLTGGAHDERISALAEQRPDIFNLSRIEIAPVSEVIAKIKGALK